MRRGRGGRLRAPRDRGARARTSCSLDISLPGPDGIELLKAIRTLDPDLPILVLSMHAESVYAERALRAGANGYIMKQEATDNVLVALRRILRREVYVSERIANTMLRQLRFGLAASRRAPIEAGLSDRELEVFRLIGDGLRDAADRRRAAAQREDRRVLPGAHQGEAGPPRLRGT